MTEVLTATTGSKTGVSTAIYRRILGGPESDACLHPKTLELVRDWIRGGVGLDTGVGRGHLTRMLAELGPDSLLVTDYERHAADAALDKVGRHPAVPQSVKLRSQQLDLCSDLSSLGEQRFDAIICVSVLMHLPPDRSQAAIRRLAQRLTPNGRLVIAVLATEVAQELFIPALSRGPNWYYPRLKGLPDCATETDVPSEAHCLAECYVDPSVYLEACHQTDCRVTLHDAIAGEECKGSVYEPIIGRPLWNFFVLDRR